MSRRPGALRIDYLPGPRARAVLTEAQTQFPEFGLLDLIDYFLINGHSALMHNHWRPAALSGRNRNYWHPPAPVMRPQTSTNLAEPGRVAEAGCGGRSVPERPAEPQSQQNVYKAAPKRG